MARGLPTLDICSRECGAKCCRAPLVLSVTPEEEAAMRAANPAVEPRGSRDVLVQFGAEPSASDRLILDFALYPGGACPYLDQATNECTVYDVRPESCRTFPDRAEPWCLVWPD